MTQSATLPRKNTAVHTATESAKQLAATDEPMPEKAKPAKTREEAKEVFALWSLGTAR